VLAPLLALAIGATPHDFIDEARALSRLVACDGEVPEGYDPAVVSAHCAALLASVDRYVHHHADGVRRYLAEVRPAELKGPVIYPFSGVDLAGTLTLFPAAEQIDHYSEIAAGDPRRTQAKALAKELASVRSSALSISGSRLDVLARLELPGALSCFLIALDLFGAKPISVRYFAADGQYVDDDFTNVEIRYVMPDGGPPRVFRHHGSLSGIAVGPGAAVILRGSLAASWRSTALREQILRADWILSDGSGPSPKELERAGFTLETYGQFGGRPERLVPFHFGQVDAARNYPLLVARRDAAWKSVPVVLTASTSTTTPPEWTTWRASDVPDVAPIVEGGKHARLLTAEGPVHVWRPAGYNPASAGIAIYLHGYFTTVDRAWIDHRLAAQFAASGRNALFIVPEASIGDEEMPPYLDLEALLAVVEKSGVTIPSGPLVVAAHSGGFRGLIVWLANPRVKQVVMIDALYGKLEELRAWLDRPGHKAILIGAETDARSTYFTRKRKSAARRETMPLAASELTPKERRATVLSILAQHDHMGLIVSGQVLPVALEVSDLPALRRRKK